MSDLVKYEQHDAVAVVTINRPDKMNAFTSEVSQDMQLVLERAHHDDSVRVIVLTGAGRCFSAGADLRSGFDGRPVSGKLQHEYRPVIAEVMTMPMAVAVMRRKILPTTPRVVGKTGAIANPAQKTATAATIGSPVRSMAKVVTVIATEVHSITFSSLTPSKMRETTNRPTSKPRANPNARMFCAKFSATPCDTR